jgi:hypothetical protein
MKEIPMEESYEARLLRIASIWLEHHEEIITVLKYVAKLKEVDTEDLDPETREWMDRTFDEIGIILEIVGPAMKYTEDLVLFMREKDNFRKHLN